MRRRNLFSSWRSEALASSSTLFQSCVCGLWWWRLLDWWGSSQHAPLLFGNSERIRLLKRQTWNTTTDTNFWAYLSISSQLSNACGMFHFLPHYWVATSRLVLMFSVCTFRGSPTKVSSTIYSSSVSASLVTSPVAGHSMCDSLARTCAEGCQSTLRVFRPSF